MTEPNERITALEVNMTYVLSILAKREDYQNSVLVKLTTIELKQDQAILYQQTCDAERTAHANRIRVVENTSAHDRTVWSTLLRVGGGLGGIAALVMSIVNFVRHP
jgi:hypothetical protein